MANTNHPVAAGERPLPHSIANKLTGWSGVASQYPIFGQTWFGYRMRGFLIPLIVLAVVLCLIAAVANVRPYSSLFYLALLAAWVVVALALSLGRALAMLVCRRKWTAPREAAGIVCALLIGVLAALSLTPYTRVEPPQAKARVMTAQETDRARTNHLVNLAVWLVVLVWLGGASDLLAYFRQRRMLREAQLLEQLDRYKDERNEVEMRLSVLASQIEPHFLFNTLSGVRAAMLSDPARGIVMIDHLVDYLRSTIPQLRADRAHLFVALGSQLDSAQAYLGIIQARLPRLSSRIDCPDALRGVAIPPLMLISLVENAVKHGIELKKGPGEIRISATRVSAAGAGSGAGSGRDSGADSSAGSGADSSAGSGADPDAGSDAGAGTDLLQLSVADDGVGFGAAATGSGIGLSNIRERLRHLYGGEAALSLRAGEAGGVVASITLPIRPMPEGAA